MKNLSQTPVDAPSAVNSAAALHLEIFNPGPEAIFPVTSTLIYGQSEAVLVDAQFQKKYAKKVAAMLKASGKKLKYIFISHSDPDYYFGLDEIIKAFPGAKVFSTAQTAYLISASEEDKLKAWKDKLGADAPDKLYVPEAVESNKLTLDGQAIEIMQKRSDAMHSFLWIPSLKTVLGGISVAAGAHLWMADTPGLRDLELWIGRITDMQALKPLKVIPGHYISSDFSPAALNFVKKYLEDYQMAAAAHKQSTGIIADMEKKYPKLAGNDSLVFGAKVFTGQAPWQVARPYPPIGGTAEVNFGGLIFALHFKDNKTMSFEGLSGAFKGVKDTVQYTAMEVGPKIFMVYWHEPAVGSNVVHVQDWNNGIVYTNIAGKDNSFTHMKGTIVIK